MSSSAGIPATGPFSFSPKGQLPTPLIAKNKDVSISSRLRMHGASVRLDDLLKENRRSRIKSQDSPRMSTNSISDSNCNADTSTVESAVSIDASRNIDAIPLIIENGFDSALPESSYPSPSLQKASPDSHHKDVSISPISIEDISAETVLKSFLNSAPENPVTPITAPEIPPEIPKISNLRGGRGLRRFTPESHNDPPTMCAPEPPSTPPLSTNLLNPYNTPDPTPKKDNSTQNQGQSKGEKMSNIFDSMKTICAICQDDNLITLNGILLECGDYVHRACLIQARLELTSSNMIPICGMCGSECLTKSFTPKSDSSSDTDISLLSPIEPLRLEDGEQNNCSFSQSKCQVESLHVRAFIHKISDRKCELMVRVVCDPFSHEQKFDHVEYNDQDLIELSHEALSLLPDSTLGDSTEAFGNICLISSFSDKDFGSINGYLFENCIILAGITSDGTEVFHKFYDLSSESLFIYSDVESLCFRDMSAASNKQHNIRSSARTISSWISVINGKQLIKPSHNLSPGLKEVGLLPSPFSSELTESNIIEIILCVPLCLLEYTVSNIIGDMHPQDRLGLVVISEDGSTKVLSTHKTSWTWDMITKDCFYENLFFEETDLTIPAAAEYLLSPKIPGKQQAVIFATNFGITGHAKSASSSASYYSVSYKELPLPTEELSTADTHSIRHYYASSSSEIINVMKGIFISERYNRYEDVKIKIEPFSFGNVERIEARKPQASEQLNFNGCEVSVGKLLAGQYNTVLFDIYLSEDISQLLNFRDLVYCSVTAKSATSLRPYNLDHIYVQEISSPHSPQILFDCMVRRLAEILLTYRNLDVHKIKHELYELSNTTIEEVQDAMNSFKTGNIDRLSSLFGDFVLDFDPVFSDEAMSRRAKYLAWGFCQFARDINNLSDDSNVIRLRLLELIQTLDSHRTVICRNDAERIFFETLPVNRI